MKDKSHVGSCRSTCVGEKIFDLVARLFKFNSLVKTTDFYWLTCLQISLGFTATDGESLSQQ